MPQPWDVPHAKKFKVGDRTQEVLYLAVGKALTNWEGLIADLASIFAVLTVGDEPYNYIPAVRAFGSIASAAAKAEMVSQAAEALFHNFERQLNIEVDAQRKELRSLLKELSGWSSRRNDIAHGYVTEHRSPDYSSDDQPVISTYLLCPSHSASRKWPMDWEPAYKYRAADIDAFSIAFDELADKMRDFSLRLDDWKTKILRENPF